MGDPIVLGGDHRGVPLKAAIRKHLEAAGYDVKDFGPFGDESVNYPEFAAPAARAVSEGEASRGIVICGSGLGVSYTANRFPRVRAALVRDVEMAKASRKHNDANMLALPATTSTPRPPGRSSKPGSRRPSRAAATWSVSSRSIRLRAPTPATSPTSIRPWPASSRAKRCARRRTSS